LEVRADVNGHHLAVGENEEDLLPIVAPYREVACVSGNLAYRAVTWEGLQINLYTT
jgi:hypothetical protein